MVKKYTCDDCPLMETVWCRHRSMTNPHTGECRQRRVVRVMRDAIRELREKQEELFDTLDELNMICPGCQTPADARHPKDLSRDKEAEIKSLRQNIKNFKNRLDVLDLDSLGKLRS